MIESVRGNKSEHRHYLCILPTRSDGDLIETPSFRNPSSAVPDTCTLKPSGELSYRTKRGILESTLFLRFAPFFWFLLSSPLLQEASFA